jgi:transcription elongation GreA/GreB family factor
LLAKRANAERIKEFSRNLKNYNKDTITKQKMEMMEAGNYETSAKKKENDAVSSREKAFAFARNIPKPKVKTVTSKKESEYVDMGPTMQLGPDDEDRNALAELEQKHLQSRKQVEAIKKSLGL